MLRKKDCCGCGDWKNQIKELWMKYQSVVKGIKAGPDTVYPDGDGIADIDGAIENEVARQISAESLVTQTDLSDAIADFATVDQLDTGLATVAAAKQDKLVNQLNIKSINGVSMLGSGDMQVSADSVAWDNITNKPDFAEVATSGSYEDLTDKPTIPAAQVNADWDAASGVAQILNKPSLAAVATSGDYDDLTDKPTIPSGADLVPSTSGASDGYVLTNNNGTPVWAAASGGASIHTYTSWSALAADIVAHPNAAFFTIGESDWYYVYILNSKAYIGLRTSTAESSKTYIRSGEVQITTSANIPVKRLGIDNSTGAVEYTTFTVYPTLSHMHLIY